MICPPPPWRDVGRGVIAARPRNGSLSASKGSTARSISSDPPPALITPNSTPGDGRRSKRCRSWSFHSNDRSTRRSSPSSASLRRPREALFAGDDRGARLGHRLGYFAPDAVVGHFDLGLRQGGLDRVEQRFVGGADLGGDHGARIRIGLRAGPPDQLRKPQPEQFVSARERFEGNLFIDDEAFFESLFAILELAHCALQVSHRSQNSRK